MSKSIILLRVVWVVLMLVFLAFILTNTISGWGTVIYSLVVMAVMFFHMWLSRRKNMTPM